MYQRNVEGSWLMAYTTSQQVVCTILTAHMKIRLLLTSKQISKPLITTGLESR